MSERKRLKAQNPYRIILLNLPISEELAPDRQIVREQGLIWDEAIDFAYYKAGWRPVPSEEESREWWFAKGRKIFDDTQSVWDTLMEYHQWLLERGE